MHVKQQTASTTTARNGVCVSVCCCASVCVCVCACWKNETNSTAKRIVKRKEGKLGAEGGKGAKGEGEKEGRQLERGTKTYQAVSSLISICECEMQSHLHIAHTPCGPGPGTFFERENTTKKWFLIKRPARIKNIKWLTTCSRTRVCFYVCVCLTLCVFFG